jgi:hypothetical protein
MQRVHANVRGLLHPNPQKRDSGVADVAVRGLLEVPVAGGVLAHGNSDEQKLADKLLACVLDMPALGPVDALKDAGKRIRVRVLAARMPALPGEALVVPPTLVPEAVLGTKQPRRLRSSSPWASACARAAQCAACGRRGDRGSAR